MPNRQAPTHLRCAGRCASSSSGGRAGGGSERVQPAQRPAPPHRVQGGHGLLRRALLCAAALQGQRKGGPVRKLAFAVQNSMPLPHASASPPVPQAPRHRPPRGLGRGRMAHHRYSTTPQVAPGRGHRPAWSPSGVERGGSRLVGERRRTCACARPTSGGWRAPSAHAPTCCIWGQRDCAAPGPPGARPARAAAPAWLPEAQRSAEWLAVRWCAGAALARGRGFARLILLPLLNTTPTSNPAAAQGDCPSLLHTAGVLHTSALRGLRAPPGLPTAMLVSPRRGRL
jgi:hypothetical protein